MKTRLTSRPVASPAIAAEYNSARQTQVLFLTSYPPRECGIATYSDDLIKAIEARFEDTFEIVIGALENERERFSYPEQVKFVLNTDDCASYKSLSEAVNLDENIGLVVIQHEFGLFGCTDEFMNMLRDLNKPILTVFHTVLPNPDEAFRNKVRTIGERSTGIMVMTDHARRILCDDYGLTPDDISVIPHGTHMVEHVDKDSLKKKYGFTGRFVLSTFGLLSSGKGIETTLDALPDVVRKAPDTLFLIIGRTHPGVVAREGEAYREFLEDKVASLGLERNVQFINKYVPLDELLEYLQLTDIYLFTSKDPNQAVSGTFAYAASCGCAIISTPIPPAVEFLGADSGLIVGVHDSEKLSQTINRLIFDVALRESLQLDALHKIVKTAWENVALTHAKLFERYIEPTPILKYQFPAISISHVKTMTTGFGMLQFCQLNHPDRESGYTLDDNARALIVVCQHYEMSGSHDDLRLISKYLDFIRYCQLPEGNFLNYVDIKENFTTQNRECNLEDSNGRAIWALGYAISLANDLPKDLLDAAQRTFENALPQIENWHSPRAMAFAVKGLYYYNSAHDSCAVRTLIRKLADRLCQMYIHETTDNWQWFESYLTYANSVLPESLLYAYKETGEETYREIAVASFNFLLAETFTPDNDICVISNRNWYMRGEERNRFGEQPIDVAYTLLALENFYTIFKDEKYRVKMESAFEWFLGRNHLGLIMYNPCTGGCYDGLEEHNVNLNQGAESTLSYLLARLCMEKTGFFKKLRNAKISRMKHQNYTFSV
jgi:glycosyltransferase involved in cell wall biosynthesis